MVSGLKPEDFDSKLGASEVPEGPGLKSGDSDWTLGEIDSTLGEIDSRFAAFGVPESFEMILAQ